MDRLRKVDPSDKIAQLHLLEALLLKPLEFCSDAFLDEPSSPGHVSTNNFVVDAEQLVDSCVVKAAEVVLRLCAAMHEPVAQDLLTEQLLEEQVFAHTLLALHKDADLGQDTRFLHQVRHVIQEVLATCPSGVSSEHQDRGVR